MSAFACDRLCEVAPELALATLPGRERAAALAHLDRCAECRTAVEELSDAADALLLLAPEAEPPAGFAGRVLSGVGRPRRSRRPAAVRALAAAAMTLTLVVAAGVGVGVGHHGGTPSRPSMALHAPGVRVARFVSSPGEQVQGEVFSDADRPSWVFMTVRDEGSSDTYRCELELADGRLLEVGSFELHDGMGSWGKSVAVDLRQLKAVRLLDERGETAAVATS